MKKKLVKAIWGIAIVSMLLGLNGCAVTDSIKNSLQKTKQQSEDKEGTKVVKSSDGVCEVTLPKSFKETTNSDSDSDVKITIEQENKDGNYCFLCIPINKSELADGVDIAKVRDLTIAGNKKSITNAQISNEKDLVINKKTAKYYEVNGDVNSEKAIYFIAIVEGKDSFYEISCFTLKSSENTRRDSSLKILKSFKEAK